MLGTGDLSKLTTQQRVEYLVATCKSLGLNPLTRPIRFLSLNGQIQIYFTRDGTDQLRSSRNITLHVVDKSIDAGVFSVTVRARTKDGREDEDIGAIVLPASGDSRANALMKAITKAKRRVTLSICGLGQTDESELDTMPGARVFDAEDDVPVAPIRTARDALNDTIPLRSAAAATPRAPRKADAEVYDAEPAEKPQRTDEQWRVWIDKLRAACADSCRTARKWWRSATSRRWATLSPPRRTGRDAKSAPFWQRISPASQPSPATTWTRSRSLGSITSQANDTPHSI